MAEELGKGLEHQSYGDHRVFSLVKRKMRRDNTDLSHHLTGGCSPVGVGHFLRVTSNEGKQPQVAPEEL